MLSRQNQSLEASTVQQKDVALHAVNAKHLLEGRSGPPHVAMDELLDVGARLSLQIQI